MMMNSVFLRYSFLVFLFSCPAYAVTVVNLSCNIKLNARPALDEGTLSQSILTTPLKMTEDRTFLLIQNLNGSFLVLKNVANQSEYLGKSRATPRIKVNLGGGYSVVIEKDLHVVSGDLENPLKGSFRINVPIKDFKTFSFQPDLSPAGLSETSTIVSSEKSLVAISYSDAEPLHKSYELEFEKIINSFTVSKGKVTEVDENVRTPKERISVKVKFFDQTTEVVRFENGQLLRTKNP